MNTTSLPNSCHDELSDAVFKASASDFCVDEVLGFDPAGDGEHLWVHVRKSGWNTRDVADLIAAAFKISARDVGYSGLKDRNALTTQWLSIPLAGLPDRQAAAVIVEQALNRETGLECLKAVIGRRKLKSGSHRANRFNIVLRDFGSRSPQLENWLQGFVTRGFPNYFGAQRFGHQGSNLARAASMFRGKQRVSKFKRGIYLSAARAQLFNLVLAERVRAGTWNQIVDGELCILDGSNSVFSHQGGDEAIHQRCTELDIHPSGPMYGRGKSLTTGLVAQLETTIFNSNKEFTDGLESAGLTMERRSLRAVPTDFTWQWINAETLELTFTLRRGVYATSLLAEIANVRDASHDEPSVTQNDRVLSQ